MKAGMECVFEPIGKGGGYSGLREVVRTKARGWIHLLPESVHYALRTK